MDAIALLKADHAEVEKLFKRFEELGPRAKKTKADIAEKVIEALSQHAAIEEQILYPTVRGGCQTRRTSCSRRSRSTTSPSGCSPSSTG